VPHRYLTLAEAEAAIPELESIFACVLPLHSRLRAVGQDLAGRGHPPTAELVKGASGPAADPEVGRLQGQFRALYETLAGNVRRVEELGGHVKDLEVGLVDFYSLRGGRDEVFLCWRLGEKRIAFWHDLESGFGGRHPVQDERFVGTLH
jgi:hypothetical protein